MTLHFPIDFVRRKMHHSKLIIFFGLIGFVAATPGANYSTTEAQRDLEEVKRIIHQHIDTNHGGEYRLALNRPTSAPQMVDFAPDSIEARVADATTQFGLNFINKLSSDSAGKNVIFSPLSLQNLMNMLLLGTKDRGAAQQELVKLLGYDVTGLMSNIDDASNDRLKPHEAMHNVFENIIAATHLTGVQTPAPESASSTDQELLLNTNPSKVSALLQTANRDNETLLTGQLNFTLANLVLTNQELVKLRPEYEKDLKTYYDVKLEQFHSKEHAAEMKEAPLHERVNNWVKNMTQNMIEKIAEESDLSGSDLAIVLLNAAHFKGRWLHTFSTKATYDRTFYNHGNEKEGSKIKFMRQKATFGYADFGMASLQQDAFLSESGGRSTKPSEDSETLLTEDGVPAGGSAAPGATSSGYKEPGPPPVIELSKEETRRIELTSKLNCSVLMLPFSLNDGQELSMVIFLPAKRDGVAELQAALDGPSLNEIYRSLSEQTVQVELPKFTFEDTLDAKKILQQMGLKSIFEYGSNLDRMYEITPGAAGNGMAKVDKVIHKAKINVDETGAEAAAVSSATIVLRNFIRQPTPVFVADHPFLFIIRHNRSNMPLFMGRVSSLQ